MEFLLYLTPQAQDILNQVYRAKYSVRENIGYCRSNQNIFGYADFGKKFIICTNNIKNDIRDDKFINAFTWWILNAYDDKSPTPDIIQKNSDAINKSEVKISIDKFL